MYKIIGANQVEYGPITAEQVRQWIAEGRINAQTLAQGEGETGWKPISSYPEFAGNFPAAPTPTPMPGPGAPHMGSDAGRATAKGQMAGPAIALMVVGILGVLLGLANLVGAITGAAFSRNQFQMLEQQNAQAAHWAAAMQGPLGAVTAAISVAVWAFVIFSSVKMKNLESYGLCITGCILAMLPCNCCCCLGIPFAIWGLIMLNKPDIKAYFT